MEVTPGLPCLSQHIPPRKTLKREVYGLDKRWGKKQETVNRYKKEENNGQLTFGVNKTWLTINSHDMRTKASHWTLQLLGKKSSAGWEGGGKNLFLNQG